MSNEVSDEVAGKEVYVLLRISDGTYRAVALTRGERGCVKELLRQMHDGVVKVGEQPVSIELLYRDEEIP